jgi:4-carboxymuconolactone decarboxylase
MPATTLLDPSQAHPSLADVFERAEARFGHVPNLVKALASNPAMCRSITDFMLESLGPGRLDWALKELLILKTLRSIKSYYSYGAHERLALELGVAPEKIGDLAHGLWHSSPHFSDGERALLALVEQIDEDANDVSDAHWDALRTFWNDGQLLEATAVITTFLMIGRVGDTLGVADPVLFRQAPEKAYA